MSTDGFPITSNEWYALCNECDRWKDLYECVSAKDKAVIEQLTKERDELKATNEELEAESRMLCTQNGDWREELYAVAAQNVALRSALSWAERNMDAETLAQFESEDDCHCPFCEVATPNLAESVLKRRDAETLRRAAGWFATYGEDHHSEPDIAAAQQLDRMADSIEGEAK